MTPERSDASVDQQDREQQDRQNAHAMPGVDLHPADLASDLPVELRDAENCIALFWGQKLTQDTVRKAVGLTIRQLLQELLDSSNFRSLVLPPLLLREALPHVLLDFQPSHVFIDWAQNRLPLTPRNRLAIAGAKSWAQLLELVLSDVELVSISKELADSGLAATFQSRLAREPLSQLQRSVIGVVDSSSAFEVRGWAVDLCDKATPVVLEFYNDNVFVGSVLCTQPRPDVADVVGGNGNYGFVFKISTSHRSGFAGGRTLSVLDSVSRAAIGETLIVSSDAAQGSDILAATRNELRELRRAVDRIEARLPDLSRRASIPIDAYDEYWERFYRPSPEVLAGQRHRSKLFDYRPLISVVIPLWNSNTQLLNDAIKSVISQTYDNWEMVLTDDASDKDELRSYLHRYAGDARIHFVESATRTGIALNTNRGIQSASGDYVAFLDHDDELSPDALYQVVACLQQRRYGLIYSDEDRVETDEFGRRIHHTPNFKPCFDSDLLLSLNYICHLVVIRKDVLAEAEGLRPGFDGAQDHDLLLRVTEKLQKEDIFHLARILYHWRVTPGSVSRTPHLADAIQRNIVTAVNDHLRRTRSLCIADAHKDPFGGSRQFATRQRWSLSPTAPKVSIIVATRDRLELLRPCVQSVLGSANQYPGELEILIVDNDSSDPATLDYLSQISMLPMVRIQRFRGPFNYSAINNSGARRASGDVLIFLNNDTVVLGKDWCAELASNAMRPEVGAVGARLLYADGTIQHAGVVTGIEGVAGHESVGELPQNGGYFGRTQLQRSVAAVTGACLATKKQIFDAVGEFDELDLKVAFNDVDYCMKVRQAGFQVIYNPFAVLYHLESKSRGREITHEQQQRHRLEAMAFRSRWTDEQIADPYYNSHFERFARPFERLRPPALVDDLLANAGSSNSFDE